MTEWLNKYRKNFLANWFSFNSTALFIMICMTYVALLFAKRLLIIDSIAAFEVLNERGEIWIFDIFYGFKYMSVPIFMAWKWSWTTLTLWIGCFMFGYRIHYNQLWKVVMLTELFFLIPESLKIVWFSISGADPSYQDYMAFYPFSFINLVDYTQIDPKWIYPLKALNLFEVVYWFLLGTLIYLVGGKKIQISIYIVLSSYVFSFLLWLGFYLIVYD